MIYVVNQLPVVNQSYLCMQDLVEAYCPVNFLYGCCLLKNFSQLFGNFFELMNGLGLYLQYHGQDSELWQPEQMLLPVTVPYNAVVQSRSETNRSLCLQYSTKVQGH